MTWQTLVVEFGFSISLLVNALLFLPQIKALLKNKSAEGVSLITFAGFNVIQLFTLLHGLLIGDYLLVAGYLLSLLTCGAVTVLIVYYRKNRGE
ncbi:PQ-loop domain-containing transporter [Legionella fairfieldensis]|uniref:PQ-loop domain-containing transporter n=1 Tax=Legionella fairfieldensis TaxID=45064 RepID=UPI00048CE5BF|nr:PQ-loop domain-containing transporter [Legionella fairfieldensis]